MDKILIKNAIKLGNIYYIDNQHKLESKEDIENIIKGRLKILNFEEFKLDKTDIMNINKMQFLENKIVKLELEYTNLNFIEAQFISNICYIVDIDGFKFKPIHDQDIIQAIAKHLDKTLWELSEDMSKTFIPKLKMKITIFYMLPNEETDYFLEAKDCEIEEL